MVENISFEPAWIYLHPLQPLLPHCFICPPPKIVIT